MLKNFVEFVERNHLDVDSIIISINEGNHTNKRYEYHFKPESRNNIRSISKVVSCLGVHKAIEKGLFNLDSDVLPFFSDTKIRNHKNMPHLKKLKIRHLLSLTMGHDIGLMFSKDIKKLPLDTDFIDYILNYDIEHEPGTFFVYNNAATYLLCAIIQKLTGVYFSDCVHQTVLQYLGLEKPKWESSHQGICLGASGLHLNNEEMHRIALLLLNNGIYAGKTIIDSDWIDVMHTPHVFTADKIEYSAKQNRCINKMGYGYHCWICGDGSEKYPKTHYFIDGTDGQFLIVSPKYNMALTILSHQKDMNPFYEILNDYVNL